MPTSRSKVGTAIVGRRINCIVPSLCYRLLTAQPAERWELSFGVDDDATGMCQRGRERAVSRLARMTRILFTRNTFACNIGRFQAESSPGCEH